MKSPFFHLVKILRKMRLGVGIITALVLGLAPVPARCEAPDLHDNSSAYQVLSVDTLRREAVVWVSDPAGFLAFGSGREVALAAGGETSEVLGRYEAPGEVTGSASLGNFLYLGEKDFGLGVLDSSDPEHPSVVASLPLPGSRFLPGADGDFVAVLAEGHGLFLFQGRQVHHGDPLAVTADGVTCSQSGAVVAAEPCTLNCTASALPSVGPAPLTVAFSATSQQTFCPEFPTFIWDFGDGSTSTIPITTHTYAQAGTYVWTLTATAAGVTCTRIGEVSAVGQIPGDCDGNASISIGEVQQAINMFLGLQASGCGVDCSGNGTTSIGEVQKVMNGFLGLPSSC
jgi:hypothetical protein